MASTIRILTASSFPLHLLQAVATGLEQQFRANVDHSTYVFDLERALDRPRGQYLSAGLLRQMQAEHAVDGQAKLLGITDVDLFAPVLTFVFGEAQLGGTCAILSTFRLRNEFYGIPTDIEFLQNRIVKEAIHETGHLYGLIHCRTFDCVMRSSTYVEEIDLKSENLCSACRLKLKDVEILNNDTLSGMRKQKIHRS